MVMGNAFSPREVIIQVKIVREPRVRGTSTTGSHYEATTGENTAD
jgi:hypothetical protein